MFRLFPYLGYCEWCYNEHRDANISLKFWFQFFGIYTPKLDCLIIWWFFFFDFLRTLHSVFNNICTNWQLTGDTELTHWDPLPSCGERKMVWKGADRFFIWRWRKSTKKKEKKKERKKPTILLKILFMYLSGCTESSLWHVGSSVFLAACGVFSWSMWDRVPPTRVWTQVPCIGSLES